MPHLAHQARAKSGAEPTPEHSSAPACISPMGTATFHTLCSWGYILQNVKRIFSFSCTWVYVHMCLVKCDCTCRGALKHTVTHVCVILCNVCLCLCGAAGDQHIEPRLGYSRPIGLAAQIQTANCAAGFPPRGQTNTMRQKMAEGISLKYRLTKDPFIWLPRP